VFKLGEGIPSLKIVWKNTIKAGGSGLGLYLTKKMATELLCGSVGVESIVGKGSTFSLRIPKILRKEGESNENRTGH
jgi:signal transduction histidine kinase